MLDTGNNLLKHIAVMLMAMCFCFYANAQQPAADSLRFFDQPSQYQPARGRWVGIGLGSGYAATMGALYTTWYSDYPISRFHTFDDNNEWLQMDKVGHAGSVYYLARWTSGLVRWTGKDEKSSALLGTGAAYLFLLTVETFDGFSEKWGFSTGDIAANTIGAGLFLGQELLWKEQRISVKFSYTKSALADVRPEVFGSNLTENVLKDYNGQTYWASVNLRSFAKRSRIPAWLNVAVGYGGRGMPTAVKNGILADGTQFLDDRYRAFYLSPDIDWTKIKTEKSGLKMLFKVLNFIKIPAPALMIGTGERVGLLPFYF